MKTLPSHLGGHANRTHKDFGALDCLMRAFGPRTAIDLGCGPGGMVQAMNKRGLSCVGIDGDHTLANKFILHDFTTGPLDIELVDLCWTVEFLEHIAEQYLVNVWPVLGRCKVVFCTHALPQAAGNRFHYNCRPEQYWIDAFGAHGFDLDEEVTGRVRQASTMVRDFARTTGKVFVKR